MGGGVAGVRDLADEGVVLDEPELDGAAAVADGVGDQLADDQLGDVCGVVQSPDGQLVRCLFAGVGDDGGLSRQAPCGDVIGVEGLRPGEEQGDVVGRALRQQRVQDAVAGVLQGSGGVGQRAA